VIHVKPAEEVFFVFEYAEIGSVGSFIEREQDLPPTAILRILK
jgi:hypothetical protein